MPIDITQIETYDSAMILNQEEGEWEVGWLNVYKRHSIQTLLNALSVSTTAVYSDSFYCAPYSEFLLMLDLTIPGSASILFVDVELSDDNSRWYRLEDEEVNVIQFNNADGSRKVCVSGKCIAPYFRLKAIASAGTWNVTGKVVFNS